MAPKKRIIDARDDSKGTITHVKFQGNSNFTPVSRAIPMADHGQIENTHVVRRHNAKTHLRTNPDGKERNNLDYLAEDT